MTQIRIAASDLRTGDICAGSGFTVTHDAWRGVRTPSNKVEVEGKYPSQGKPGRNQWNRNTQITVYRP